MTDGSLLARTYELAGRHRPHPNPAVGAVITNGEGTVIGEGAHHGPGNPHAETVALSSAEPIPDGSTLYVSLEPCSHTGRTPPCVEAIIASGIEKVVVGTVDPDPRVSGAGIAALEEAGVEVVVVGDEEAEAVDPQYFHHRRTGLPLVTLKYAMTLDGSVAAQDRTSQWITTPEALADAHRLRSANDGVMVGAGTLRTDDPLLDVRLDEYHGPQPRPLLVIGASDPPPEARIWSRSPLVIASRQIEIPSGELIEVTGGDVLDLGAALRAIGDAGILSILVEGGPKLAAALLADGWVDRVVVYVGPKLGLGAGMAPLSGVFATIGDALEVEIEGVQEVGGSIRIDSRVRS